MEDITYGHISTTFNQEFQYQSINHRSCCKTFSLAQSFPSLLPGTAFVPAMKAQDLFLGAAVYADKCQPTSLDFRTNFECFIFLFSSRFI